MQEVEKKMNAEFAKERKEIFEQIKGIFGTLRKIKTDFEIIGPITFTPIINKSRKINSVIERPGHAIKDIDNFQFPKSLSKGAQSILSYLESVYPNIKTKTQISIATGYAPGGGFNNLMYELTGQNLITKEHQGYSAMKHSMESFDSSLSKWESKLSKGAWKILQLLLEEPELALGKSEIADHTGYAEGGGFNNLIYELTGKELIKKVGINYIINAEILDLC